MKTTTGISKHAIHSIVAHDKYAVYFYLAVIAALLALMILTQFGTKFY